jgi:NTE family protein
MPVQGPIEPERNVLLTVPAREHTATQHSLEAFAPAPRRERSGLALCLSGGGYRAALFHLGALRRLNELGILSAVDTITAVSGGSILAAHLAATMRPWPAPGQVMSEWDRRIVAPFLGIARQNIRTPAILRRLLPWNWFRSSTGVRALAHTYERIVTGMKLVELPERPRFVFCATDMEFGVNWQFRSDESGDYRAGYAPTPRDWSVGRAVAASSAFPPVFNPLPVDLPADVFRRGRRPVADLRLTDGGVYDNLGLEPVWKSHATLLVSDGGAPFAFEPDRGLLRRLRRYTDIISGQVGALRKRWLVSNFMTGTLSGTYWGVSSAVASYEVPNFPGYSEDLVDNRIATVRTDLDAFSDAEMDVLENHGYTLAAAAIARHAPQLVSRPAPPPPPPPPPIPPHRDWMDEPAVTRALAHSHARTLLGRW